VKNPPVLFVPKLKTESDKNFCDLLKNCSSPPNIFVTLFRDAKTDTKAKKFELFIDLISNGADFNKELSEDKSMIDKLADFLKIESDDEEINYVRNNPLLQNLNRFKKRLVSMPKWDDESSTSPSSRILYMQSINFLQSIASFYEKQLPASAFNISQIEQFFPKTSHSQFFSKNPPDKIENILNFLGFLIYLKDSKFMSFLHEKFEKSFLNFSKITTTKEELDLKDSLNNLILKLPKDFEISIDQQQHNIKIEDHNRKLLEFNALLKSTLKDIEEKLTKQESKNKRLQEAKKDERKKEEERRIKLEEKEKRKAEERAKKDAEKNARKQAEENAQREAEDKMRKEAEENIRKDNEKKLNREVEKSAKRKQRQEAFKESQELKENIEKISEQPQADFKKFQSFFDFLRQKTWLNIGEVGLFGSRVYKEIIKQSGSCEAISDKSEADLDFFCIPKDEKSRGIFTTSPNEVSARINLASLLEEFNATNPNLQISFLKEENGKKSVNHGRKIDSLNFKLVANFLEDKIDGEKTEKIVKEQIEFDLNFYTQQSISQNLQWQLNLERVLLHQDADGNFQLKINQSNCDSSQEEMTIKKFISSTRDQEQKVFLYEANPQASGFLNRILTKKGVYKYLDEETLDAIKIKLLNNPAILENLKKELQFHKDILDRHEIESQNPSDNNKKIAQAKLILDGIREDKIFKDVDDFKEILKSEPNTSLAQARVKAGAGVEGQTILIS
jgi:hypothetical protein